MSTQFHFEYGNKQSKPGQSFEEWKSFEFSGAYITSLSINTGFKFDPNVHDENWSTSDIKWYARLTNVLHHQC